MKKFTQIAFTAIALLAGTFAVKAQSVGIGTTTPNVSARLDISATNKGLLIPQVNLVSLTDIVTIPTPAKGLMVFNTNATLGTGFYFNNGTTTAAAWLKFQTGSASTSGWGLTGNAATDSTINFLGTTDAKPLMFRVNNGHAGMLGSRGGIALGRGANGKNRHNAPSVIAIGDSALFNNLDSFEIAIGNKALFNNNDVLPSENVAIGDFGLFTNTIGFQNVAVGRLALAFNDTAFSNVAVGYRASLGTEGEQNTAVGAEALTNDFAGFGNTAVGFEAHFSNNFGFFNTAIGFLSLANTTDGNHNVGVGVGSLIGDTTGERNIGIGFLAAENISSGSRNIAIGTNSMFAVAAGNNNICIGDSASTIGDLTNAIAIGNKAVTNQNNRVIIGSTANNSIGGAVGWTNFSDGRYKKDVEENVSGLKFIMELRPVTYHLDIDKMNTELYGFAKTNPKSGSSFAAINASRKGNTDLNKVRTHSAVNLTIDPKRGRVSNAGAEIANPNEGVRFTGFIAQEVEAAAKKIGFDFSGVDKPANAKSNYGLRYAEFVVPLVKAVQEQQAIIDAQNKKIDDLIKRLEKLENK